MTATRLRWYWNRATRMSPRELGWRSRDLIVRWAWRPSSRVPGALPVSIPPRAAGASDRERPFPVASASRDG